MLAILLAVQWVEDMRPLQVISSDSSWLLASLQCSHSESRPDILIEIKQTIYRIIMTWLTVTFLWIPAHSIFRGNEKVEKEATTNELVALTNNFWQIEIKSIIRQRQWEKERRGRWLYQRQRREGENRSTRRQEVIIE